MSSQTSIGMGSGFEESDNNGLTPEGGSPPGETYYDCIAYVLYCGQHKRMALSVNDRAVWLPFIVFSQTKTWESSAEEGIQLILNREESEVEAKLSLKIPTADMRRIHILRIQNPINREFITRLTYFVKLGKSSEFKCCENSKRIQWIGLNDIINNKVDKLWGHEVKRFADLCKTPKSQGINEFTLGLANSFVPKGRPKTPTQEERLMISVDLTEKKTNVVFDSFLEHMFPAFEMTLESFKTYLLKYKFDSKYDKFPQLFNAFDFERSRFLSFLELLKGLASMEEKAEHSEVRVDFLFHFYDTDGDGYLSLKELKTMIKDMEPNDSSEVLERKTREALESCKPKNGNKVKYTEFIEAVGKLKFRGTSKLCRYSQHILQSVVKSVSSGSSLKNVNQKESTSLKERWTKQVDKGKGLCVRCKAKKYEFCLHTVKFDTEGRCFDPRLLEDKNESESNASVDSNPLKTLSIEYVFKGNSLTNVLIELIKEFHKEMIANKDSKGLLSEESQREPFVKYLKDFCADLQHIFECEDRVLKVNSPVYVLGDTFANLDDILAFESMMFSSFPVISSNLVFLGNYVDYGKCGVECVIYLMALKLFAPNKVFLLRGRHEVRDIQSQNTFQKECDLKYGTIYGPQVWELINDLFDRMPFALIVDESIFCSHSGIPKTRTKVHELNKINKVLKNPLKEAPLVWELLTNIPTERQLDSKNGFIANTKQGFGYFFNEVAVNKFLNLNSFTHIICGNNRSVDGFHVYFEGQFISLYSSSKYPNINTKPTQSAAALLFNNIIQILRLDTTDKSRKPKSG